MALTIEKFHQESMEISPAIHCWNLLLSDFNFRVSGSCKNGIVLVLICIPSPLVEQNTYFPPLSVYWLLKPIFRLYSFKFQKKAVPLPRFLRLSSRNPEDPLVCLIRTRASDAWLLLGLSGIHRITATSRSADSTHPPLPHSPTTNVGWQMTFCL